MALKPALETPGYYGAYRFTDPGATNHARRFYQLRSPWHSKAGQFSGGT
jgi:hypothetical protein